MDVHKILIMSWLAVQPSAAEARTPGPRPERTFLRYHMPYQSIAASASIHDTGAGVILLLQFVARTPGLTPTDAAGYSKVNLRSAIVPLKPFLEDG